MQSRTGQVLAVLVAAIAVLALAQDDFAPEAESPEPYSKELAALKKCYRPVPKQPYNIQKPQNWSDTERAECPMKCKSCCTAAWDQYSYMMTTMPRSNCSICLSMRYTLGTWTYNAAETTCPRCLMDDFAQMMGNFQCDNDNGECAKCCMDLTMVYSARFIAQCPEPIWRKVPAFKYSSEAPYKGCSSCEVPDDIFKFSPSPSPPVQRAILDMGWATPTRDESDYDFEYLQLKDMGIHGFEG